MSGDLSAATTYADRALNAPRPHLYVYMIAAAAFSKSGNLAKAESCVDAIHAKKLPFGKSEFLTHFNLRNPETLASLSESLGKLNV